MIGGLILNLTYGIEAHEQGPFVTLIERANQNFNAATVPGAFLVDFFPALRHLPEWLPGMGFKKLARDWAKDTSNMAEVPYAFTKAQMVIVISQMTSSSRPDFLKGFGSRTTIVRFRPAARRGEADGR